MTVTCPIQCIKSVNTLDDTSWRCLIYDILQICRRPRRRTSGRMTRQSRRAPGSRYVVAPTLCAFMTISGYLMTSTLILFVSAVHLVPPSLSLSCCPCTGALRGRRQCVLGTLPCSALPCPAASLPLRLVSLPPPLPSSRPPPPSTRYDVVLTSSGPDVAERQGARHPRHARRRPHARRQEALCRAHDTAHVRCVHHQKARSGPSRPPAPDRSPLYPSAPHSPGLHSGIIPGWERDP